MLHASARTVPGIFVLSALTLITPLISGKADARETADVSWETRIEIASGGGYRGPWRQNRSDYDFVDDPTIAIDEAGTMAVAWADQSRKDILFQRYGQDGMPRLEKPINVSRSPEIFSWVPRLLIPSDDEVYIVWQEILFSGASHGGEIFFARSTDGGATFSDPVNLSRAVPGTGAGKGRLTPEHWHNGSLDLVIGPEGNLYAAWTEYDGPLWFSRSTDRGASFSDPVRIAGGENARPTRGPSLAVDPDGVVYLAWTVGEERSANIQLAWSGDQGRSFDEARTVHASSGHADAPKLAVDGRGTVHLAYAESPRGPFERYHVRYSRSTDRGKTFAPPREISSTHGERFESAHFPSLGLDGAGNLYAIWELFPSLRSRPQGLGFVRLDADGEALASPSIVPGSAGPALGVGGGLQGLLLRKLAVNDAGTLAVVHSTFKRGESSEVWLFRGRAAGH